MSGPLVRLNNRRSLAFGFGGTLSRLNRSFNLRRALRTASNMRNRFSGSNTMTRQKRRTSGRGVTAQHDRGLIYRKSRMPRFRRRRWKAFRRKVLAVSEKDLGSRTVVRNDLVTSTLTMDVAGATAHVRQPLALYPLTDTGTTYMNDIREMSEDTDTGTTGKLIFLSGVLDITVRNSSTSTVNTDGINLEIDVYEITVNRNTDTSNLSAEASSLNQIFNNGHTDTGTIPGQTTALTADQRGWTPWDCPTALSQFRVRIWKKTKYFLSENQTFTYQYRDPRRHTIQVNDVPQSGTNQNQPGMTRFFYIVWKPTPGYTYQATTPDTARLSIGVTRKYLYKLNQSTQDFDAYNS